MVCTPSGNPAPSLTPNPLAGIISPFVHRAWINAIDSLLVNCALTKPCRLIFGNELFVQCPNCKGGRYNGSGPTPFPVGGVCPVCHGRDKVTVEEMEDVSLLVIFDNSRFFKSEGGEAYPPFSDDFAQTLCRVELYQKIVAAEFIVLDTCITCAVPNRYQKYSHPTPIGLGPSQYILTTWKRINK